MAMTVTVTPNSRIAGVYIDVAGHQHSSSTVIIWRRVHPLSRELPSIAFVPEDERYREVVIVAAGQLLTRTRYIDWHARATVPYQYAAREVFADGVVQPFSAWTA